MAPTFVSGAVFPSPSASERAPRVPAPVFFLSTGINQTQTGVIASVAGICVLGAISCALMLRVVISQVRARRQRTAALVRQHLRKHPHREKPLMYQVTLEWAEPFDQEDIHWESISPLSAQPPPADDDSLQISVLIAMPCADRAYAPQCDRASLHKLIGGNLPELVLGVTHSSGYTPS